jgi:hypothetical protein
MSKLIVDGRRNPIQTGVKKRGTYVEKTVNASSPDTFTPNPAVKTLYEVRTTGDIRIAAHETGYTFVKANEPKMFAYEIDYVELSPSSLEDENSTVTFVGDTGNATVSFVELA